MLATGLDPDLDPMANRAHGPWIRCADFQATRLWGDIWNEGLPL